MDANHFDALTRLISGGASRRRLLTGLAALPVVGGLLGIPDTDETDAHGRRKRRKKAHKHGKGRRRKHRHGKPKPPPVCLPDCAGKTCGDADGCGGTCTNGCAEGLVCADGRCIADQGTCPAGASTCAFNPGPVACNEPESCQCQQTTEGQTVCINDFGLSGAGSLCGACGTSAECVALYPAIPGVVCVATSGSGCCSGDARGFCGAPCNYIFT